MPALQRVVRVVKQSNVVLEMVDARFPHRSGRLRKLVRRKGRKLLLVVNKVDLADDGEDVAERMGGIAFSAKTGEGKEELLEKLEGMARGRDLRVGVVGRPNVGKSSLINALKGRKSAKTSAQAGYTRGEQWVRVSPHVTLIDSPGVITGEWDREELVLQDALDVDRADNPERIALKLFRRHPEVLEKLGLQGDGEEALEEFARRTGKLKKGGVPNTKEAARMVVRRWQRGEL